MGKKAKKSKIQEYQPLSFLDQIAPAAVKFNTDHFILGSAYHSTLALRGYPTGTEELALLSRLGEHSGVTLHIGWSRRRRRRRSSTTPPTKTVWTAATPTT